MTETELNQWLLLYFQDSLPPRVLNSLLVHYGGPAQLLCAPPDELLSLGLCSEQLESFLRCLASPELQQRIDQALEWTTVQGQQIIVRADERYPPLLKEIHDPPLLLFVLGQSESLLRPQIAIVGSRRCSVDGLRNTRYFAQNLVAQGFSICSGLARGIDGAAHDAALGAEGVTVAVMGTGADKVYPLQHRKLASAIQESGALVSELPLGSGAIASHFPKRNRIISGMSLGLVVVEAALKSGSLISARLAMEQNREVFAIPGSIRNPLALGPHRLIQQGALLVDTPEQIVEHLYSLLGAQLALLKARSALLKPEVEATNEIMAMHADQKLLLEAMGFDPVSVETLVERTTLSLSAVQTTLLNLELLGKVRLDAGHYVLS